VANRVFYAIYRSSDNRLSVVEELAVIFMHLKHFEVLLENLDIDVLVVSDKDLVLSNLVHGSLSIHPTLAEYRVRT